MTRGRTLRAWLLGLLVWFAATSAVCEPVSADYFGLHIHRLGRPQPWLPGGNRLSEWPQVSFGAWRLWDAYVSWPYLQPERSRWDFGLLDKYLSLAHAKKVKLVLPLGLSPGWASVRPGENSGYQPGNAAPPRDIEDWRRMVRKVVARCRGRVEAYELWNEVNLAQFYTGTLEELVALAEVMYEEVKRADSTALVVSPSFTNGLEGVLALERYLALGGGAFADVIAFHFYTPRDVPESMLEVAARVKQVMAEHGQGDKPLWNTESGLWIENIHQATRIESVGEGWTVHGDRTAGGYLARAMIVGYAAGLARYYWYAWDNIDMGLVEASTGESKLSAKAYGRTVAWLRDSKLSCQRESQGLWKCALVNAQGRRAWILWAERGEVTWLIPEGEAAESAENVLGEPVELLGKALRLGSVPVKVNMQ